MAAHSTAEDGRGAADGAEAPISFVIPVLDEAAILEPALAALQPLRQRGHEVVLVDGGSRDDSAAIAAALADRVLGSAPGRARQMNAGAAHARHAMLCFLHADTRLPEAADAQIAAALAAGRSGWGRFDVVLDGDHPLLPLIARLMNRRSCWTGICTGDQALFLLRGLFERIGGFPDIPLMEDIELSRRLRRSAGPPVCLAGPVVTSARRWERGGVLRTILRMWALRAGHALGVAPAWLARHYR